MPSHSVTIRPYSGVIRNILNVILFLVYLVGIQLPIWTDPGIGDRISALILARSGSKGIRLKNLSKINNSTLLGRTITTIQHSQKFFDVWVSVDDQAIADEAFKFGAKVHYRRPFTATDDASSLIAVQEFLSVHPDITLLALVQCTSPFLTREHLSEAVDLMKSGKYSSVFSVTRQYKLRWKINNYGEVEADNFDPLKRPRRQDWDGELIENGMFYFAKSKFIMKWNSLQPPRSAVVEVPGNLSLEIDSPVDLVIAEHLMKLKEVKGVIN